MAVAASQKHDDPFLFTLYASTREHELAAWGWPAAQQESFLRLQFIAQQSGHATAYPHAILAIIVRGEIPIGAIRIDRSPEVIYIVDFALLSKHRNGGLGTRLLRDLMNEARAARKPLRLQVLKTNPALRLYLRLGFTPASENALYLKMEWRG